MPRRPAESSPRIGRPGKYEWRGTVLPAAAAFIESFKTGVTLRQCFYHLATQQLITNTAQDYALLSEWTTRARDGELGMDFPDFVDNGRRIEEPQTFKSPADARAYLVGIYRRDRQEFADMALYLAVEKAGLVAQLWEAFVDLGIPIMSLGGFASQTLREQVRRRIARDGRPAVLIYAGDFDPAGVRIDRSFVTKIGLFEQVVRVGLNIDQLAGLPVSPFPMEKAKHSLINGFKSEYGDQLAALGLPPLVQFELDALAPDVLLGLYRDAIEQFLDMAAYQRSLELERVERAELELAS
jgi:hypothetical protein